MFKLSKRLLDHFANPRNVGEMEDADGYARVENPVCGDLTDVYVKVRDGRIDEARFKSLGCFATIASASALTEAVKGISLEDVLSYKVDETEIVKKLMNLIGKELGDLPEKKWHCPPATVEAFLKALLDYYERRIDKSEAETIRNVLQSVDDYYKEGRE